MKRLNPPPQFTWIFSLCHKWQLHKDQMCHSSLRQLDSLLLITQPEKSRGKKVSINQMILCLDMHACNFLSFDNLSLPPLCVDVSLCVWMRMCAQHWTIISHDTKALSKVCYLTVSLPRPLNPSLPATFLYDSHRKRRLCPLRKGAWYYMYGTWEISLIRTQKYLTL